MTQNIKVGVTQRTPANVRVGTTGSRPNVAVSAGLTTVEGPQGPPGPPGPPGDPTLAIHTGPTPPDDHNLLWLDTSTDP